MMMHKWRQDIFVYRTKLMRCIVVGSHQIYIDDKQTQKNWQSCKQKTWVEYALRLKSLILTSLTIPFCFFHLQTHLSTEKFYVQKREKNASNYSTFIQDTKIHEKAFFVTSFNMSPYVHLIVDTFFEPNFSLQKLETLFLLLLLLPLE